MLLVIWFLACISCSYSYSSIRDILPSYNASAVAPASIVKRTEPTTGYDDFPPNKKPHPNPLDKVEGAFHDALELAAAAVTDLNSKNNTIFLHYFAK